MGTAGHVDQARRLRSKQRAFRVHHQSLPTQSWRARTGRCEKGTRHGRGRIGQVGSIRRRGRRQSANQTKATAIANDIFGDTIGRAGKVLRTDALSRHLHAGRIGFPHRPFRSPRPGKFQYGMSIRLYTFIHVRKVRPKGRARVKSCVYILKTSFCVVHCYISPWFVVLGCAKG